MGVGTAVGVGVGVVIGVGVGLGVGVGVGVGLGTTSHCAIIVTFPVTFTYPLAGSHPANVCPARSTWGGIALLPWSMVCAYAPPPVRTPPFASKFTA